MRLKMRQGEGKRVRWTDWVVVAAGVILVVRTGENVLRLVKSGERVTGAETRLEELKVENQQLKGELAQVKSPEFIEKEARDKLGYGKEGEVIVVLPLTPTPIPQPKPQDVSELPNWQKWWKLYIRI